MASPYLATAPTPRGTQTPFYLGLRHPRQRRPVRLLFSHYRLLRHYLGLRHSRQRRPIRLLSHYRLLRHYLGLRHSRQRRPVRLLSHSRLLRHSWLLRHSRLHSRLRLLLHSPPAHRRRRSRRLHPRCGCNRWGSACLSSSPACRGGDNLWRRALLPQPPNGPPSPTAPPFFTLLAPMVIGFR